MALFETSEKLNAEPTVARSMRCHTDRGKRLFDVRRFNSEAALLENAPWHLEPGATYHILSSGDVDALTFLRHVVRQQHLAFCLVSSWCYGVEDVSEMGYWLRQRAVDRFDFYCGEIAKASYAMCAAELGDIARAGGGRLGVFRNHSKVMAFFGDRFDGVITSSANINTNPRTEQTVITCDTAVAEFYKSYFDEIRPFNNAEFENWTPWKRN